MNRTNTSDVIKKKLNELLDKGVNNTTDLYGQVSDMLGVHRVVVRRVARELRQEYQDKINTLQNVKESK